MKLLARLILLFFSLSFFAQSPWTQEKGKAYTQLSFTTIPNYSELFGVQNYSTERKITDNTLRLYAEYGLTNKTSVFTAIPFKTVKAEKLITTTFSPITTEGSLSSFGNVLVGIKHNFYNKKWLITGQISIESNTQKYSSLSGVRTGYDAWTITPLVIGGRSFDKWYIQAYTGADFRTNDYSTAFKLGGEIGYEIVKSFWFIGFADGVASFTNGDVVIPIENQLTGLYVDRQSYSAFGIKMRFEVNHEFGVNLGAGLAFGGRRIPNQVAFSGGIYYKFL